MGISWMNIFIIIWNVQLTGSVCTSSLKPDREIIDLRGNVTFTCKVCSLPLLFVIQHFTDPVCEYSISMNESTCDSKPYTWSNYIETNSGFFIDFSITNFTKEMEGNYTCMSENGITTDPVSVFLNVSVCTSSLESDREIIDLSGNVTFTCKVCSLPLLFAIQHFTDLVCEYNISKNESTCDSKPYTWSNYIVTNSEFFINFSITNFTKEMEGNYTCMSGNGITTDPVSVSLNETTATTPETTATTPETTVTTTANSVSSPMPGNKATAVIPFTVMLWIYLDIGKTVYIP